MKQSNPQKEYADGYEPQPADLLDYIASEFPSRRFWAEARVSRSHPYLIITIPDRHARKAKRIRLAPLYDVQWGSRTCDEEKFERHIDWIRDNPEVYTWLGGDLIDWNTKLSIGSGVFEQKWDPENQIVKMAQMLARIRDRILFAIPGNHELRGAMVGIDAARWYSTLLQIPYFGEPVFCDIRFCGHTTALYAWHGRGAARTEGAITNVTMEPLRWVDCDLVWCGHLHRPRFIPTVRIVRHPEDMTLEEREVGAVMSPSYQGYFNSYASRMGYGPAPRGLVVANIYTDGTWEVETRGKKREESRP